MRLKSLAFFALVASVAPYLAHAQDIPLAGQLQINGGPTIIFTDTTISCGGLSPGDSVALVGFVIDRQASSQTIATPMISQTADTAGNVSAVIDGGIKPRSIWMVIDQTAGSYTVAAPQGCVLRQMADGTVSLAMDESSASAIATINRAHTHAIEILGSSGVQEDSRSHIRALDAIPSGFAVFDAKDGSSSDTDGAIDGTVHLTLPSFFAPTAAGSALFVIDDRTLEFDARYFQFNLNNNHCRQGC